jgi:hypothetical protein
MLCFSLKIETYNALAGVQLLNLDKFAIVMTFHIVFICCTNPRV